MHVTMLIYRKFSQKLNFAIFEGRHLAILSFCKFGKFLCNFFPYAALKNTWLNSLVPWRKLSQRLFNAMPCHLVPGGYFLVILSWRCARAGWGRIFMTGNIYSIELLEWGRTVSGFLGWENSGKYGCWVLKMGRFVLGEEFSVLHSVIKCVPSHFRMT